MLNRVVIVGRVTADIELQKTNNGTSVARFTLAINKTKDEAIFINCQAWKQRAEYLAQYASKGNIIGVDGRIDVSKYTDSKGVNHNYTYVIAENVRIFDRNRANESENVSDDKILTEYENDVKTHLNMEIEELPF